MSRIRSGLIMLLALAVSGGGQILSAQQGQGGRGLGLFGIGPRLGENVALALEFQDQLGLSQDQVASLQVLQNGIREDLEPLEAEVNGLRAGILAGEVNSGEGLATLQGLVTEYQAVAAPYRTQVDAILTPAQHQTLQGIMWENRPVQGQGLGVNSGVRPGLGYGQGVWLGRGAGAGLGRGGGLGLRQGGGAWLGQGAGLGRATGLGLGRGGGRGLGRGRQWRY